MSEELKPCPANDLEINHKVFVQDYINDTFRVTCICGWSGPTSRWRDDAIAAWNRRAEPAAAGGDEPTTWDAIVDLEEQIARVIDRVAKVEYKVDTEYMMRAEVERRMTLLENVAGYGQRAERGEGEA